MELWRVVEIALTSSKTYASPFQDVQVTATFEQAGSPSLVRPAFWDGGQSWKVRFAAPNPGRWMMTTSASNESDYGLHRVTRWIDVQPYQGSLPIYQHGFLRVGPDKRHFVHADGTPFFYLGDTHWLVMHERWAVCNQTGCASQFKTEVDKRVSQGFTVYQTEWMAGGSPSEPDSESFYYVLANCQFSESDLNGFRNADRKFGYLSDRGLVVAAAVDWRDYAPSCDDGYLRQIGRYWAARYAAFPILWTIAQESDGRYIGDPPNLDAKWQTLAEALRANDAYASPLTAHMCSNIPDPSGSWWRDKPYHDWFAAQLQGGPPSIGVARAHWSAGKPVVFYEPPYENFWTDQTGERVRAYIAYQSGFAGFGYGVAGIWDDNYQCTPVRESGTTYDPDCKPWYDGLARGSGDDMSRLRGLYRVLPWWNLVPRFDDPTWGNFVWPAESRLATDAWKTVVVYFFQGDTATGTLRKLNSNTSYRAQWFDPRSGNYTDIATTVVPDGSCTWVMPAKPDTADWVLLVDANDKSAPVPSCAR